MDKISRTVDELLGKTAGIPFGKVCEEASYLDAVAIILSIGFVLYAVIFLLRIGGMQRFFWQGTGGSEIRLWRLSHVGGLVPMILIYVWVMAETSAMTRVLGLLDKLPESRAEKILEAGNADQCVAALIFGAFRIVPEDQEAGVYFAALVLLGVLWLACVGFAVLLGYILTWAWNPSGRDQ